MCIKYHPSLSGMASDNVHRVKQSVLENPRSLPESDAGSVSMGVIWVLVHTTRCLV